MNVAMTFPSNGCSTTLRLSLGNQNQRSTYWQIFRRSGSRNEILRTENSRLGLESQSLHPGEGRLYQDRRFVDTGEIVRYLFTERSVYRKLPDTRTYRWQSNGECNMITSIW